MTTNDDQGTVPVACTLGSADLAAQAAAWARLGDRAMIERTQTADGLRITFRPEAGAEEDLRRLVAVENECCAWATWTVRTDADTSTGTGRLVLDIRSTGDGVTTLHGMFT
jgi:hypothetical protein